MAARLHSHPSMPEPRSQPRPERASSAPRPACPRCGARLGVLDPAGDGAAAPEAALYCGCCGLVLPAPQAGPHAG